MLIPIFDCNNGGCSYNWIKCTPSNKTDLTVLRLKPNVPNRKEIVKNVLVICHKLQSVNFSVKFCKGPRQVIRLLLTKCFGNNFSEVEEYYDLLLPLLQHNDRSTIPKHLGLFCSRATLLIYQLAVMGLSGDGSKLSPCFGFQPKSCRPSHILQLPQRTNCWEKWQVQCEFQGLFG